MIKTYNRFYGPAFICRRREATFDGARWVLWLRRGVHAGFYYHVGSCYAVEDAIRFCAEGGSP